MDCDSRPGGIRWPWGFRAAGVSAFGETIEQSNWGMHVHGVERVRDSSRESGAVNQEVSLRTRNLAAVRTRLTSRVSKLPPGKLGTPQVRPGNIKRISMLLLGTDAVALVASGLLLPVTPPASLLMVVVAAVVFQSKGLYRSRLTLSLVDDIPGLTTGLLAGSVVSAVVAVSSTSIWRLVFQALLALGLLLLGRACGYAFVRAARRRGWVVYRTVIVGTGPTAQRVARTLNAHPEHGLRVVGFIGPDLDLNGSVPQSQILEDDPAELASITQEQHVSVVIVTHVGSGATSMLKALRMRDPQASYTLFLVPPLFQMLHSPRTERIRDVALIRLGPPLLQVMSGRAKRLIDILVSLTALVVLAPVLALTALAVRFETGRKVLFPQERVGSRGKVFTLYKFQSMIPTDSHESATNWSVHNDDRIGRVGRFIRKTSLDELPQLLNILHGDMSLVGPRPERPHFVEKFNNQYDSYRLRHRVRPGLTGWAAVNGLRGDTSIEERAYFDNVYIDNWSLWLDMKIIARTFLAVFGGQGS